MPRVTAKRLVLVVPEFPKLSETFIASKLRGLLERGWDVHVVCARSRKEQWRRYPDLGRSRECRRRVHVALPCRPRLLAVLLWPLAFLRCTATAPRATLGYLRRGFRRFGLGVLRRLYLDAELIRLRPDLIHFEFGALAVGRTYLGEALKAKVVVSFRGYDINYVGLDTDDHYLAVWKEADALHFLGRDLAARARRRGCPADKPHALIPPAVDPGFFSPKSNGTCQGAGMRARPLYVLSVGRLEWKKGYEYAMAAVRLLRDMGIDSEYRIVGHGKYLEAVAFACHQLGLDSSVKLLGGLSPTEVKAQMEWADVLLHAAVSEGFCNAVIEAQAMGLPVVCTDADGLPENVSHGETGFVVSRRSPESLAEKLRCLAGDPDLRQCMGQAARQRVLDHFRIEGQVSAFDRLYRHVLGSDESTGRPFHRSAEHDRVSHEPSPSEDRQPSGAT